MGENTFALESRVVTMQFTKGGSELLAHAQATVPEKPGDEVEYRWLFNTFQLAASNGLGVPEGAPDQYVAESDDERDRLAEELLDAVNAARAKADELTNQVAEAFGVALPALTSESDDLDGETPSVPQS